MIFEDTVKAAPCFAAGDRVTEVYSARTSLAMQEARRNEGEMTRELSLTQRSITEA
jgi:hypothetical protein